jgi:hypothetical protein
VCENANGCRVSVALRNEKKIFNSQSHPSRSTDAARPNERSSGMLALATAAGALTSSASEAAQSLAASLPPCVHKAKGNAVRSFIALEVDGESTQARSCLLKQLTGDRGSRSASTWALAAAVLPDHASTFAGRRKGGHDQRAVRVRGERPLERGTGVRRCGCVYSTVCARLLAHPVPWLLGLAASLCVR